MDFRLDVALPTLVGLLSMLKLLLGDILPLCLTLRDSKWVWVQSRQQNAPMMAINPTAIPRMSAVESWYGACSYGTKSIGPFRHNADDRV